MGCSSSPEIIDNPEKNKFENEEEDLMPILYLKLSNLITNNPFYNVSLSDFENTINSLNEKINKEELNLSNIIDEITIQYLNNQENFIKILFKDVINHAFFKFKIIFEENDNDNENDKYNDDNHIIYLILYFMFIFLSNKQPGKKQLFREKIKILLNEAKGELNKENQYKLSKLFNILLNFVQMFSFFFGCFFVFFCFLDNFDNYNRNPYEEIINNKKTLIKEVESIINNNLKILNEKISPYFLNLLVISEINNKIKFLFEKVRDNEELIYLEDYELKIIADSLFESLNTNNYIDYLFFGENHDY